MAKGTRFKEPVNKGKKYRLPLILNILALLFVLTFSKAGGVIALILIAISFYLRKKRAGKKNFNIAAPKANKRMSIAALVLSALVVPLGVGGQPAETNNSAATQTVVAQSQLLTKSASQVEESKSASLIAEKEESANVESIKTEDNNFEVSKNNQAQNKHQAAVSSRSTAGQKASTKQTSQNNSKQKPQETPQVQVEKKQERTEPKAQVAEKQKIEVVKPVEAKAVAVSAPEPKIEENVVVEPSTIKKKLDIKPSSDDTKVQKNIQGSGSVVYTAGGKCYHRPHGDCPSLHRSRNLIAGSVDEARAQGKMPCKLCYH